MGHKQDRHISKHSKLATVTSQHWRPRQYYVDGQSPLFYIGGHHSIKWQLPLFYNSLSWQTPDYGRTVAEEVVLVRGGGN